MNRRVAILLCVTLLLIGSTAGILRRFQTHQRLGPPAVKTKPIAGAQNLEVVLPETVLDYKSEKVEQAEVVTNTLPKDTSFGQRVYKAPDGFQMQMNVVLMGADRTSLHKPQFCLQGQGWKLDQGMSSTTSVRVDRPVPYDLPLARLVGSIDVNVDGQKQAIRGVCLYYYIADGVLTASPTGAERMWLMAKQMLTTGTLQRWAYVMCFAGCAPGQEDATIDRMKQFIAASAPEFQLTPKAGETKFTAR
jgi:hypothetical protein